MVEEDSRFKEKLELSKLYKRNLWVVRLKRKKRLF